MRTTWMALAAIGLLAGCCTTYPPASSLAVPMAAQETSMWCWAASGEMTMEWVDSSPSQCEQANQRFGRSDCCNTPTPGACVNGGWPNYDHYGFEATRTSNAALSWTQVRKEIYCAKRPFAFSWHWSGGGGHMMVLTGYATLENQKYVYVNDPWPPNTGDTEVMTYDEYVSGTGHTHWDDFYQIKTK